MKEILKFIVNTVHILSFCGTIIAGVLGFVYEVVGYVKFEKILSALGISKGYDRFWAMGMIAGLLMIITYVIKHKFFAT